MSNLPNPNRLLLIFLLSGGVLFVLAALCIAVFLLLSPLATLQPEPTGELAQTDTSTQLIQPAPPAKADASPELQPTATLTTLLDATEPPPTAISTAASVAGDKVSLPTVTPTSSPLPTPTRVGPSAAAQPVEGLRVGNIAPNFTLGSNRANRVSLSELHGKIVILNFWATWCPPCRHEVPTLEQIHNEYGPQGVVVLAVNLGEKLENVERFAHDNGISFAVWLDEDLWAGNTYNIHSIPTTYFIDQEGIIRAIHLGPLSRDQVVVYLEEIM